MEAVISGDNWEALLPPMQTCSSCTVEISCGAVKRVFNNVAIGEVWLAGGQSNMEFELQNDKNGAEELAACAMENVRYYYTPKCAALGDELEELEANTKWMKPSAENSRSWSAVAYYFAKELSRKLGVTVGIIGCSWGGTSASAWMSREYLSNNRRLSVYLDEYDEAVKDRSDEEMIAEYNEYSRYQEEWEKKVEKCQKESPDMPWQDVLKECGENRYPGPHSIINPTRPCGLYETMLSRVTPYTLKGFLYYQGESDDNRPEIYYDLMKALIENWRSDWKNDNLPFLFVQLPMFKYKDDPDTKSWAVIRDAQMRIYKTVKNTGIADILDCGEFNNIHPSNKEPVGHRLYLQALSEVYKQMDRSQTLPAMYCSQAVRAGGLRLYFANFTGFFCKGELGGFEIAGADGVFHEAEAVIEGDAIYVKSSAVPMPVQARFLWTNYAKVTLFCGNDLPLSTFKTEY